MGIQRALQGGRVGPWLSACAYEVAEVGLVRGPRGLKGQWVTGPGRGSDVRPALFQHLQLSRPARGAGRQGELLEGHAERVERFTWPIVGGRHESDDRERHSHGDAESRHEPPGMRRLVPGSQIGTGRKRVAVLRQDLLAHASDRRWIGRAAVGQEAPDVRSVRFRGGVRLIVLRRLWFAHHL